MWSPDGTLIASGGVDATIQIWDARTGKRFLLDKSHTSTVWTLAWSPDGKRLASASQDKTMRIWQVKRQ